MVTLSWLTCFAVQAHPALASNVWVDRYQDRLHLSVQIPQDQLFMAAPMLFKEQQLQLDQVTAYLKPHIKLLPPSGEPLTGQISNLHPVTVNQAPYLAFEVNFNGKGAVLAANRLHYDVILHRVVTHKVMVSIRRDFYQAIFPNHPELLAVLHYNHYSTALTHTTDSWWRGFKAVYMAGLEHIQEGTDHLLFLLCLLLPAPLVAKGKKWQAKASIGQSIKTMLALVTAFTCGHCLTLALVSLKVIVVPARPVEALVAFSILVSAIHAYRPILGGRGIAIAASFGLVHGMAFAETMSGLGFNLPAMLSALLGFNLGIESMQLVVVVAVLPWLLLFSRSSWYSPFRNLASVAAAGAALVWLSQRLGWTDDSLTQQLDDASKLWPWLYLALVMLACGSQLSLLRHKWPIRKWS